MYYWVKGSTEHAICNGCKRIHKIDHVVCRTCWQRLPGNVVKPTWDNDPIVNVFSRPKVVKPTRNNGPIENLFSRPKVV